MKVKFIVLWKKQEKNKSMNTHTHLINNCRSSLKSKFYSLIKRISSNNDNYNKYK